MYACFVPLGGRSCRRDAGFSRSPLPHPHITHSPLDAFKLARQNPDKQVVFFAIGFETTALSTAVTLLRAKAEGIENFSIFCNHVTIIPAMKAILDSPDLRLDGFGGPGHVSMVIGMRPYNFVARDHHKPVVIAGFEPLDIIQSVYMIVKQISEGRAEIENQYARVVRPEGNVKALQAMAQTMELRPFFEWRGLGFITHSALKLRPEFADWDAELRYEVPGLRVADPKACQCGEVLKGVIKPWECKVFGTACTPETPIGTCMVSPEGACAAYYSYGRFSMASERSRLNVLPMALQYPETDRSLKDPTRGGVATALNEMALGSEVSIALDEHAIPVNPEVRGACEILGLDPLTIANEGKMLAIVSAETAQAALDAMRSHPLGREAAIIGTVQADPPGMVFLLMKFQFVHNFVNYFSFRSDGDTNEVQAGSLDTTDRFAVCGIVSGRKHLFCIDSGLYFSGERRLKHSG